MYSGISGMRGFQTKLDVIGNNIANVNTVGFKASRVIFKDILSQTLTGVIITEDGERAGINPQQVGLGSAIGSVDVLHTPGSAMTTNITTDLLIDGDGFFAVSASEDQEFPYLTRAGNFMLDGNRNLVTGEGMFVQQVGGGNIQLEDDVISFSIAKDGSIVSVSTDGTTEPTGIQIGIVKVANPNALVKNGGSMFSFNPNANPAGLEIVEPNDPVAGTGAIISGKLEMSNVDLSNEFTEMIVAQRGFQANSRMITTSDEILQELVNLKR